MCVLLVSEQLAHQLRIPLRRDPVLFQSHYVIEQFLNRPDVSGNPRHDRRRRAVSAAVAVLAGTPAEVVVRQEQRDGGMEVVHLL